MIDTYSVSTTRFTWVTAHVPESFDEEREYQALDDALGPWGGHAGAIEVERVGATTIIATYENH